MAPDEGAQAKNDHLRWKIEIERASDRGILHQQAACSCERHWGRARPRPRAYGPAPPAGRTGPPSRGSLSAGGDSGQRDWGGAGGSSACGASHRRAPMASCALPSRGSRGPPFGNLRSSLDLIGAATEVLKTVRLHVGLRSKTPNCSCTTGVQRLRTTKLEARPPTQAELHRRAATGWDAAARGPEAVASSRLRS